MGGKKNRKSGAGQPGHLPPPLPPSGTSSTLQSTQQVPSQAAGFGGPPPINNNGGQQAGGAMLGIAGAPEVVVPSVDLDEIKALMRDIRLDMGSMKQELQAVKDQVSDLLSGIVQPAIEDSKRMAMEATELAWQETTNRMLMVVGIPAHIDKASEPTLHTVFERMCQLIGYQGKILPFCRMHRRHVPREGDPVPVTGVRAPHQNLLVLEFAFKNERAEFYAHYLDKARKIRFKSLGLGKAKDDTRVYVNEYLSRKNAQIKKRALELKVKKKLRQVFTRNGIVYVLVGDRSLPQRIDDLEALNRLEKQIDASPTKQSPKKPVRGNGNRAGAFGMSNQ